MEGGGTLFIRDEGAFLYFEANRSEEGEGVYKVMIQGVHGSQMLGTMGTCEGGLKLSRMVSRSTLGKWGCLPVTKAICERGYLFEAQGDGFGEKREDGFGERGFLEGLDEEDKGEGLAREEGGKGIEGGVLGVEFVGGGKEGEEEWERIEEDFLEEGKDFEDIGHWGNLEDLKEGYKEGEEVWVPVEEGGGFLPCFHPERGIASRALGVAVSGCVGVLREEGEDGFSLAVPFERNQEFGLMELFCLGEYREIGGRGYLVFGFSEEGRPVVM